MEVRLLVVPYDSGHANTRMGKGPEHLLRAGLAGMLEGDGHAVVCRYVGADGGFAAEIATSFELVRGLAAEVVEARAAGAFPLVLAGNCGTAVGTVAGLGEEVAAVWLDAHGDLNTPETTRSGFLDGMALSILLGRCWRELAASVPGFTPLTEDRVLHVGGRDLDPTEARMFEEGRLTLASDVGSVETWLRTLPPDVERMYLHVDLDVLDPDVGAANAYTAPGGLSLEQVEEVIAKVAAARPLGAAAITSYDPSVDEDGRALRAGADIARALVAVAAERN